MLEERVEDLQNGRSDGSSGGDEDDFGDDIDDRRLDARVASSVPIQVGDQFRDHHVTVLHLDAVHDDVEDLDLELSRRRPQLVTVEVIENRFDQRLDVVESGATNEISKRRFRILGRK